MQRPDVGLLHQIVLLAVGSERGAQSHDTVLGPPNQFGDRHVVPLPCRIEQMPQWVGLGHTVRMAG